MEKNSEETWEVAEVTCEKTVVVVWEVGCDFVEAQSRVVRKICIVDIAVVSVVSVTDAPGENYAQESRVNHDVGVHRGKFSYPTGYPQINKTKKASGCVSSTQSADSEYSSVVTEKEVVKVGTAQDTSSEANTGGEELKLGALLEQSRFSSDVVVVEEYTWAKGSTVTLFANDDDVQNCWHSVQAHKSPAQVGEWGHQNAKTEISLTGTSGDPENVTCEGVISACTGMVTHGERDHSKKQMVREGKLVRKTEELRKKLMILQRGILVVVFLLGVPRFTR